MSPAACMTVINTSPVVHLHLALPGGIGALPGLIGEVIVPHEVLLELAAGGPKDDAWQAVQKVAGIVCRHTPRQLHPLLAAQIDSGEAAVIQTALDENVGTVILDDRKARRIAATLGIAVTGTLGILVQAKAAGMLPSLRESIALLQSRGIWLDAALVRHALALAGEPEQP